MRHKGMRVVTRSVNLGWLVVVVGVASAAISAAIFMMPFTFIYLSVLETGAARTGRICATPDEAGRIGVASCELRCCRSQVEILRH